MQEKHARFIDFYLTAASASASALAVVAVVVATTPTAAASSSTTNTTHHHHSCSRASTSTLVIYMSGYRRTTLFSSVSLLNLSFKFQGREHAIGMSPQTAQRTKHIEARLRAKLEISHLTTDIVICCSPPVPDNATNMAMGARCRGFFGGSGSGLMSRPEAIKEVRKRVTCIARLSLQCGRCAEGVNMMMRQ
jgi:hypothetical protein